MIVYSKYDKVFAPFIGRQHYCDLCFGPAGSAAGCSTAASAIESSAIASAD
jgi:hypothetical protein